MPPLSASLFQDAPDQVVIVDRGRQGPPGISGVAFFDVRHFGYSEGPAGGAALVTLDQTSHADITLQAGANYIALNCGGICALTLIPPDVATGYEVLTVDGASWRAAPWGDCVA